MVTAIRLADYQPQIGDRVNRRRGPFEHITGTVVHVYPATGNTATLAVVRWDRRPSYGNWETCHTATALVPAAVGVGV